MLDSPQYEVPMYRKVMIERAEFHHANNAITPMFRCVVWEKEKRNDKWAAADGGHWGTMDNARIDARNMRAMYECR